MHVQSELARILEVVRPQRVKGRQYMTEKDTIQVLVLDADETLPGRRMIPGAGAVSARVVDMSMDAVKKGIQTVTEQISEIVRDLPANSGPASLDGISVDLNVSADGSVQWVVGLGVAVSSTVSLNFKVSDVAGGEDVA